jgi:hypothetical protein
MATRLAYEHFDLSPSEQRQQQNLFEEKDHES